MKNENKQHGDAGRTSQDSTRNTQQNDKQQHGHTPVKQDQTGKTQKDEQPYGREGADQSGARSKGNATGVDREPVKNEGGSSQRRGSQVEERQQETKPATGPEKTRETPKGNQSKM